MASFLHDTIDNRPPGPAGNRPSSAKGIPWCVCVVWLLACSQDATAQHHTYASLVGRLLDLEGLAVLPVEGERARQWSSHSLVSTYDEGIDRYLRWYDNGDRSGFVRLEDGGRVLAEMEGPGCIWRIWTADARSGHVKVFIDGASVPAIDLPFKDYFNGSSSPFDRASLTYEAARGRNSYVPISYNESCKIIGYGDWGAFFHFTYSTFPAGHTVEPFNADLPPDATSALDAVDAFLHESLGDDPAGLRLGESATSANAVQIPAGGRLTLADIVGQRAITRISLRIHNLQAYSTDAYLAPRELSIECSWDNEIEPSVWAPVGDFFGSGPNLNTLSALPLSVDADASQMVSHWYMPFARRGFVELVNDGSVDRTISYAVTYAPLSGPIESFGRFHAKWNRNPERLPTRRDRWPDWVFLKTEGGRGRFVGVTLHAYKTSDEVDPGSWPGDTWWGEGDEKLFVDGERFPSVFGTGTEDFFGYAWGDPGLFSRPYHSQTLNEGENFQGNISLNRFQIADSIPFTSSFEGVLEKYYSDPFVRYAATPYWYLESGGKDPYRSRPLESRTQYFAPPPEPHAPSARPVGWWALDGELTDRSGYDHHGVSADPLEYSTADAKVGSHALSLTGAGEFADIGDTPGFPRGRMARTLCAWVETSDLEDGFRCAVSFGNAKKGAAMFLAQDGKRLRAGGYLDDLEVESFWVPEEWRFVCLTYDGETARLYADRRGSDVVEVAAGQKKWDLGTKYARIGRQVNERDEFWSGKVDDVRVYNRELSVGEIVEIVQERYRGPARISESGGDGEPTLEQNHPNPFNLDTSVEFSLAAGTSGRLTIHNVIGQVVREFNRTTDEGGRFRVVWDGTDDAGRVVSSGLYLIRLTTKSGQFVRKMLMVK